MSKVKTKKEITQDKVRRLAESSFEYFIRLVMPKQVLGGVHSELCSWMTRQEAKRHQLILLPRDHGKSRIAAFYVAWELTRNPHYRILYISSTSNLAEKQLGFIKDIMQSSIYRRYWPEMTHEDEGKRKKWTNTEIMVDHPKRAEESIRDPSIMAAGLTTNIVGMHFDIVMMDDVVTGENAYTEEGRNKVTRQYSLLASIEGANSREVVVGTRYHPKDLYQNMMEIIQDVYGEDGELIDRQEVYEIFERQVEDAGDGTGQFLWPRQLREDGMYFGFNANILAEKKAKYIDKVQFYAQYYNNPNNSENASIGREHFQYYDQSRLNMDKGHWYMGNMRLNIVASADLAYSTGPRSDYTAIAVVGVDSDRNYYILDIDRFKTNQIKEQYEHILALHRKWDFKKLVAETVSAAEPIVEELKNNYFRPNGIMISVETEKPSRHEGTKTERIRAILEGRYQDMQVWHYRGGNCQVLEDELVLQFPPHDDCKDAVAYAINKCIPPSYRKETGRDMGNVIDLSSHPKYGGLAG